MSRRTQEQVAELWRDALGLGDERAITAVHNLGVMRLRAGRMTEAEAHMTEAFEARQRVLGDEHPTTAASLRWLSELRREQGRLREATTLGRQALPVLRSALESRNASLADDAMPIAEARVRLGAALLRTGDTAAGRALLESAAVSFEAAGRVDEPDAVRARRELATVARRSDRIRMHSCPGVGSPWPRTRFFQRRAVTMLASAAGESGWNEARLDSAGIDVGLAREALPSLLGFEESHWASARGVFQKRRERVASRALRARSRDGNAVHMAGPGAVCRSEDHYLGSNVAPRARLPGAAQDGFLFIDEMKPVRGMAF